MSIQTGFTWQALLRLGTGSYNYSTNAFKLALYTSSASIGRDTTVYTTTEEYVGTGYTAGGFALTNVTPVVVNGELRLTWSDCSFGASLTPRGAMVYNTTVSNEAVYIVDYGNSGVKVTGKFPSTGIIIIRG
jgi:hypothetical protein